MIIPKQSSRRGNALILAASLLVLLVIVATTFVSRTQTARKTASAVQRSSANESSFDLTAAFLSKTVSDALFVRLIDAHYDPIEGDDALLTFNVPRTNWNTYASKGVSTPLGTSLRPRGMVQPLPSEIESGGAEGPPLLRLAVPRFNPGLREVSDSNRPRIPASESGLSTGVGQLTSRFIVESSASHAFSNKDDFEEAFPENQPFPQAAQSLKLGKAGSWLKRYGVDPRFPANFAPYEVTPWTNWPDRPGYPWSTSNADNGLIGVDLNLGVPILSSDPFDNDDFYSPAHSLDNPQFVQQFSDLAARSSFNGNPGFHSVGEGNPLFGPGFGDTRWLRDLEPMAADSFKAVEDGALTGPFPFDADGIPDSFRQWRHLTNVASAENSWRVVLDISDVTGVRRQYGEEAAWPSFPVVTDLSIPIEQWLPNIPYGTSAFDFAGSNLRIGETGTPRLLDSDIAYPSGDLRRPSDFESSWSRWANRDFNPLDLSSAPPPNLYNLYDTNSDGIISASDGESYEARFIGVRKSPEEGDWTPVPDSADPALANGSKAWHINRYLDDADGDGFTDSFWFLPSSTPQNGVLQVVSVSITDNAGRIDLSSGSRFSPGLLEVPNPNAPDSAEQFAQELRDNGTRGSTPGDLALVSQIGLEPNEPDHPIEGSSSSMAFDALGERLHLAEAKVGFFDIPEHGESWRQIPGLRLDSALNNQSLLPWPSTSANSQPFEPYGQQTLPNRLSLVHQDYEGHHTSNTGSWSNFLEITRWNEWWEDQQVGQDGPTTDDERNAFLTHKERLESWKTNFSPEFGDRLDIASEVELRLIESHNIADVYSTAEQMLGSWRHKTFPPNSPNAEFGGAHPLRSQSVAVEQSPTFGGLLNGEWRADLRHRSTTYSRTRNDLVPNWLRWKWDLVYDLDNDGILESPRLPAPLFEYGIPFSTNVNRQSRWSLIFDGSGQAYPLFGVDPASQSDAWYEAYRTALLQFDSKIDLREANPSQLFGTHFVGPFLNPRPTGNALLSRRLPYLVMNALSDGDENGAWYGTWGPSGTNYFGFTRDVQPGAGGLVQPSLGLNQPIASGDPDFAQFDLSSDPTAEEAYKRNAGPLYSPGHSRTNEFWLRLVSAGLSANILSYRDNDWISAIAADNNTPFGREDPPRLTGRFVPRFKDIAPVLPEEKPNDPDFSQQAGMVPLPEWDRSPVRDAADRFVDSQTGEPSPLGINADPIADPNLVVPVDGLLGMELQPFLAEAAVVFLHSTQKTNFNRDPCITVEDAQQACALLQSYIDAGLQQKFVELVGCLSGGQFMESQRDLPYVTSESDHRAVVAVQLANPFDRPIPPEELAKYRISVHGMHVPLGQCWLDDGTAAVPDPFAISPSLAPLEPVTSVRNPSAIFWLPPQDWSPKPDEVSPSDFKRNLANWMDIECWHDDVQDELGFSGESPANLSWGSEQNTSRWGLTGTRRYRVPELSNPAPGQLGWSSNRCAYERVDLAELPDTVEPQTSFEPIPLDLSGGQRVVELSRVDNRLSILQDPSLDQYVNRTGESGTDGLVDFDKMASPYCVWVVVDRFDLGIETDESALRILSSANPSPSSIEPTLEAQQGYSPPGPLRSNQFANSINPYLSDSEFAVVGPKPIFLVNDVPPSDGGGNPGGGGPIGGGAGDGLQNYAFPRPGTDGVPGAGPETDTTGSKNLSDNDGLQMIYYPGIFPPYWEPGTDGAKTNPWSSANTFLQAFGVRRGWLLDLDYEDQKPGTFGVQPSEFSLQFISANQAATRVTGECRIFPYSSDVLDLAGEGMVTQYPLNCSFNFPPDNPTTPIYQALANQLPENFYADSFDRQSPANANWLANGTFINAADESLIEPQVQEGGPGTGSNQYWATEFDFLTPEGNRLPPSELTTIPELSRFLKPFSFDGERRAHLSVRSQLEARPFVFSKSLPNSYSYNQFSDLRASSLGLTFTHKDSDFDQIGEIYNIPIVGHHLRYIPPIELPMVTPRRVPTVQTIRTYSEFISGSDLQRQVNGGRPVNPIGATPGQESVLQEDDTRARLLTGTAATARLGLGRMVGVPEPLTLPGGDPNRRGTLSRSASDFADPRHSEPEMPAASRLLELFTCDGPGFNHDNQNYFPEVSPLGDRYDLARGYSRKGTRGLLNINTSSVEALRSLPNWYKAIGVDAYTQQYLPTGSESGLERFPRTWQAESVASFRDGYSGIHTHGLPIARPYFDLRESITSTLPAFREVGGADQLRLNPSDLDAHLFGFARPELARAPDPTFPGVYASYISNLSPGPMTNPFALQTAPTNNPRGIQGLGMLRQIDHRRPDFNAGVGPDGLNLGRPDDRAEVPEGWYTAFQLDPDTNDYTSITDTVSDHHFDSESFSSYYMGNTNTGSPLMWPYRERIKRSSIRRLEGAPPSQRYQPTRLSGNSTNDYVGYSSPYERADHVLNGRTVQPSVTSPVDVAGNGLPFVLSDGGDAPAFISQDSTGGDLEDANLLLAGAANILTTRSDTFVAHFRVRSFKQNPENGFWDATDPRYIVDERRLVMLIDRTNVDEPGDIADIIFLEDAPN